MHFFIKNRSFFLNYLFFRMLERKIFLCFFVFLTYFFMFWWIDCYFFIILGIPQPFFFVAPFAPFFVMTIPFLGHCDGFARGNLFPYTVIAKRQRRCGNLWNGVLRSQDHRVGGMSASSWWREKNVTRLPRHFVPRSDEERKKLLVMRSGGKRI